MNKKDIYTKNKFGHFIGNSKEMRAIYDKIQLLAPNNTPVFIEGDSGTGKEVCAQALHKYSPQSNKPFIALNCASLPHNLIESALFGHVKGAYTGANHARDGAIKKADQGTLFLDEVAELPLEIQAKLLRFCENFTYSKLGSDTILNANIRLICATNKNVRAEIQKGQFREDLYYRLYIANIKMPALKDHRQDILDLAYYYLKYYAHEMEKPIKAFSENAEEILIHYSWPGNVRELQNVIRQIVNLENTALILASMLPAHLTQNIKKISKTNPLIEPHIHMPLWKIEKAAIKNAIALTHGDIPKAAAILDVAPSTLYRKIKLWENK